LDEPRFGGSQSGAAVSSGRYTSLADRAADSIDARVNARGER
jgi:hypothetical protein